MTVAFHKTWVDRALDRLFEPERRRLNKLVYAITEKQAALQGNPCYGSVYRGERYIPESSLGYLKEIKKLRSLSFQLNADAVALYTDTCKIENDQTHIRQLLTILLSRCKTSQECRDSLPDCVASLIPELKDFPRRNPDPAFMIRDNPNFMLEYERTLPKIQFYSVTHMLY